MGKTNSILKNNNDIKHSSKKDMKQALKSLLNEYRVSPEVIKKPHSCVRFFDQSKSHCIICIQLTHYHRFDDKYSGSKWAICHDCIKACLQEVSKLSYEELYLDMFKQTDTISSHDLLSSYVNTSINLCIFYGDDKSLCDIMTVYYNIAEHRVISICGYDTLRKLLMKNPLPLMKRYNNTLNMMLMLFAKGDKKSTINILPKELVSYIVTLNLLTFVTIY